MIYKPETAKEKEYLLGREAFYRKAVESGKGNIYTYGFQSLKLDAEEFFAKELDKVTPCSRHFEPNPFFFQYDLEVHIFLNYDAIVKKEISYWEEKLKDCSRKSDKYEKILDRIDLVYRLATGCSRDEHFWRAVEIRWPITKVGNAEHSAFVREPWGEDFISGMCEYDYVTTFGGSGQGKTHRALAFMCIGWDHFIDTFKGGRALFSTVSESKMKQSTWPYLQGIYKETCGGPLDSEKRDPISLYAGRGSIKSEYTIVRPHDPKGGGNFMGLLISNRQDNSAVDKITGAHNHPFGMYHIDELQSTPDAPIKAAPNFKQNCRYSWITAAGNYDLPEDALGKNTIPIQGWANIDENTHLYESINMLGIKSMCVHYNNENSPAMTKAGEERWGHILPTKRKRDSVYKTAASKRTDEYRRFWIGWKKKLDQTDSVLNSKMIKTMGCHRDTEFNTKFPVTHGWSFDSAPANLDRNIVTHFADGVCAKTGYWKVHIFESIAIEKSDNVLTYVRQTGDRLLELSALWGVKNGMGLMDWTNMTGIPEYLIDHGFNPFTIVYNEAVPDGKRRNARTGIIDPEIVVDHDSKKLGHEVATNIISLGAYFVQQMVIHGQITGLNESLINESNSEHSFEEEICTRMFINKSSAMYGELQQLEPKSTKGRKSSDRGIKGFKEKFGFSPDILDTIFQIGYYMAAKRKMVIGDRKTAKQVYKRPASMVKFEDTAMAKHAQIWGDDLIY